MKQRLEKCTRIINDLVLYCHSIGAAKYNIEIKPGDDVIHFRISADIKDLQADILEELKRAMEQPRLQEMEFNYWAISYDSHSPAELTLLGMMMNDVIVNYNGKTLEICSSR